ncbi:hypothetical protein PF005_g13179 [Phytophthora fragariae]|uniref:Uncharacterized protein n=1 Tax=Phytophthora fragariae TaxID=53985 RepID=A0A6A3XR23_9STRA|nr:hypothetical protein PF005_g13179 [Phytophthora fragariae]KAE9304627.1 hypothetical protein PF001_g12976 [Phytophthora fragariae]
MEGEVVYGGKNKGRCATSRGAVGAQSSTCVSQMGLDKTRAGGVRPGSSRKASAAKRSTTGAVWTSEEVLLLIAAWKAASIEELPDWRTAKHAAAAVYSAYIFGLLLTKSQLTGEDIEIAEVSLETVANAPHALKVV